LAKNLSQNVTTLLEKGFYKMFAGSEKDYEYKTGFIKTTCSKLFRWSAEDVRTGLTIDTDQKSVTIKLNEGVEECKKINFTLTARALSPWLDVVRMNVTV
jgi:hypothetical protein